jgi:hypothetical protein
MVKTLDEKIKEAERKIITTISIYKEYAKTLKNTYKNVEKLDKESIPLLGDLIETMESIPNLYIELKTFILYNIHRVATDVAETYEYHREKIIQNLRRGIEILKNKEGLIKLNELYRLILDGKIPLQKDQETKIMYSREERAYKYLEVIIKGLLMDPTKYEPLYKQLIETDNLEEFGKYLQKEYEKLRP